MPQVENKGVSKLYRLLVVLHKEESLTCLKAWSVRREKTESENFHATWSSSFRISGEGIRWLES